MERKALAQAYSILKSAREAHNKMRQSTLWDDYKQSWTTLLHCYHSIHQKIGAGCRQNGKSKGWFDREKELRRNDPLLCWLHQARNADEHGTGDSIEFVPGTLRVNGQPGDVVEFKEKHSINPITGELDLVDLDYNLSHIPADRVTIVPASARMLPIIDGRSGKTFEPPASHRDMAIEPLTHHRVAELAHQFYEDFLVRASQQNL